MRIISVTRLWALLLLAPVAADAGPLLDYIRNYDLNDYALGLSVGTAQNPYVGSGYSKTVYPYLTSFRHSSLTKDWFLIQDGMGFRYSTDNDWELGVIGRFQTLGLGISKSDELVGLEDRRWTVEAGPLIGWRGFPVHVQFRSFWEAPNRHSGMTSELVFRLPWEHQRGYIVPSVKVKYLSSNYSDYYFSVGSEEATATYPEYQPGSAINTNVELSLGYEMSAHWLLQMKIGVEFLDAAIKASPIVDRSQLWSGSISLAYNPDLFQPRDYEGADKNQKVEIRLGAFNSNIDTRLLLDATDNAPEESLDLEDFLGAADNETVAQLDAYYRFDFYHRIDLGYFELERSSSTILQRDVWFGDQLYPEGTDIMTSSESRLLRLGYSYSLMRDGQKELGLTAGLSYTRFKSSVRVNDPQQQAEQVRVNTVLPTFGVFGSVPFGDNWRLGADIDIFALNFDRYDGYMAYVALDLERRFNERIGVGLGYNFYGMRLKSKNNDLNGTLRIRHQGPKAYVSVKF
jgi:outer membrane scaffolding protein for murein synthesis (MipA/OmpV family)